MFLFYIKGAAFPAAHGMWQHWVPSKERSTLISIAYSGCFFGVAIGAQFSDLVCDLLPGDNILIVYGVLGILWYVLWTWSICENPSAHPTITQDELQYLKQEIKNDESTNNASNSIPWKEVFSTKSMWALYVVHFCRALTIMYILQGDFTTLNFIHQTVSESFLTRTFIRYQKVDSLGGLIDDNPVCGIISPKLKICVGVVHK